MQTAREGGGNGQTGFTDSEEEDGEIYNGEAAIDLNQINLNASNGESVIPGSVINSSALTEPLISSQNPTTLVQNASPNSGQIGQNQKLPRDNLQFNIVGNSAPLNQPSTSLLFAQNDSEIGGFSAELPKNFSKMPATSLAQFLKGKIPALPMEAWISEDFSGQSILDVCSPQLFNDYLQQICKINAVLMRTRIETVVQNLISVDLEIPSKLRKLWADCALDQQRALLAREAIARQRNVCQNSPISPAILFKDGEHSDKPIIVENSPADDFGRGFGETISKKTKEYSFLSEVYGPKTPENCFGCETSAMFSSTPQTLPGTTVHRPAAGSTVSTTASTASAGNVVITFVQPSPVAPAWVILATAHDAESFFFWLRKNRKLTILCAEGDKRLLRTLIETDVRETVCRIIFKAKKDDPALFVGTKEPENWDEVSDMLLLRILFMLNGPKSAEDAKVRLSKRKFMFDDSTTKQEKFTDKLRSHCNDFRTMIRDLGYNCRKWPADNDDLSHNMIIDAFSDTFKDQMMITGPDGSVQVARCRNLSTIVRIIRDKKALHLNEIIEFLVARFEKIDLQVQTTPEVSYGISPWSNKLSTGKFEKFMKGGKKRSFNEMEAQQPAEVQINQFNQPPGPRANQGKPPKYPKKAPSTNPRCNNCGSKGHLCGETTCYLFGHPRGKGLHGSWPEGTESLRLTELEWKDWKPIRHAKFYSYPENQKKSRP